MLRNKRKQEQMNEKEEKISPTLSIHIQNKKEEKELKQEPSQAQYSHIGQEIEPENKEKSSELRPKSANVVPSRFRWHNRDRPISYKPNITSHDEREKDSPITEEQQVLSNIQSFIQQQIDINKKLQESVPQPQLRIVLKDQSVQYSGATSSKEIQIEDMSQLEPIEKEQEYQYATTQPYNDPHSEYNGPEEESKSARPKYLGINRVPDSQNSRRSSARSKRSRKNTNTQGSIDQRYEDYLMMVAKLNSKKATLSTYRSKLSKDEIQLLIDDILQEEEELKKLEQEMFN